MKLSKTLSIGLSHIQNIQEVMALEGCTFAQATRKLIGLGLGKYFENKKEKPTTTTTTTVFKEKKQELPLQNTIGKLIKGKLDEIDEREDPPPIEKID